jgi:uncharacterized membrane protein YccC
VNQHVRGFFELSSGRGHWAPALRVGAGIALPLLVMVLLGRLDLTVYVIFGALTGVFGRAESHRVRFRHLGSAGVVMGVSIVAGAAVSLAGTGPWVVVLAGTVLAGTFSALSDRLGLRPAGPFFFLFAFTTTAGVPFAGPLWEAALAVVGSVLTAVALGLAGTVTGPRWDLPEPQAPPLPWSAVLVRAGRYVLAVGLAGAVATTLGLGHHNWAMLAATAPLAAAGLAGRLNRAAHNVVGTYVGVGLSAALLTVDWTPLQLALLLALLQFAGEVYAVRHHSLSMVFMTPVALMMTGFVVSVPAHRLVLDRVVETTIGAAVAVALVLATERAVRRARRVLEPGDPGAR